jgi:hypothetical protein
LTVKNQDFIVGLAITAVSVFSYAWRASAIPFETPFEPRQATADPPADLNRQELPGHRATTQRRRQRGHPAAHRDIGAAALGGLWAARRTAAQ